MYSRANDGETPVGRRKLIEDDQLLGRVREIFVREGINVSSRTIAKEIGISSSVLFQRFGSKVELLFAAMTPPAPDISTLLEQEAPGGRALDHLERISWGLLEYFRKLVPVLLPLATDPSFNFEAFRRRYPNSTLEKLMVELMTVLEGKRRKSEIDCPDAGAVGANLVAVAFSLAMFERIGVHDGPFSQDTVRDIARLLWRGIAPADQRG
jgi:AcrR family transcriptional regulator